MRVLGIDLGQRRIGLALSDPGELIATPLQVLVRGRRRADDHRAIADLVQEWEIGRIVVGLPLQLDGRRGRAARAAESEARELGVVTGVPVETYDERLTTVSAHRILRDEGVGGPDRRAVVDKVAAAVLLQSWLDGRRSSSPRPDDPDHTP